MKKSPIKPRQAGFALIVTLSLMILLTVIAVGLLTLSSISLRSAGQGAAMATARANARLAMMLALGELQASLGPDQAVSARASSILSGPKEPNVVGAWKSWFWEPSLTGAPPQYSGKKANFTGWLVSSTSQTNTIDPDYPKSDFSDYAWLINPDTYGAKSGDPYKNLQLRAPMVKVHDNASNSVKGAYAWAVMDESMKASMNLENLDPGSDKGKALAWRTAPPRANPEIIDGVLAPDKLGNDLKKIVSVDTAVAAVGRTAGSAILAKQQAITAYSIGLLTDVMHGGLKQDLTSLLGEQPTSANLAINGSKVVYNNIDGKVTVFSESSANGEPAWAYLQSLYKYHQSLSGVGSSSPSKVMGNSTDLKPTPTATVVKQPTSVRLLPVISKLNIVFSIVSHNVFPIAYPTRKTFYDTSGVPKLYTNHYVPHLVYEPVVTLYNPYDVKIELLNARIKIYDPPVLFGFQKNGAWYRPGQDAKGTGFSTLGQMHIAHENDPTFRTSYTLMLGAGNNNTWPTTSRITLEPGESKVFAARVQDNWAWKTEDVDGGVTFFEWDSNKDFGNKDGRTRNSFGVEAVAGWDHRAGFQTDHLSLSGNRPAGTIYNFEVGKGSQGASTGGWVSIKKGDTFSVFAKAGKTSGTNVDFQVDLMAGITAAPASQDLLRTYSFTLGDAFNEITGDPKKPVITMSNTVESFFQEPAKNEVGGKLPFAVFTMAQKTTRHKLDYAKTWQTGNPAVEGINHNSTAVGNDLDTYDLRFESVAGFNDFPIMPEYVKGTGRSYNGATTSSSSGCSNVPMFRVPVQPMTSLGDLIHTNLVASAIPPRFTYPFGNSYAHPLLSSSSVSKASSGPLGGKMLDQCYLLNNALWDRYFFSTVATTSSGGLLGAVTKSDRLKNFFSDNASQTAGGNKLLNPRLLPIQGGGKGSSDLAAKLTSLAVSDFSKQIAAHMAVEGPFNVNSDSVDAWKALLASLKGASLPGWQGQSWQQSDRAEFPRFGLPVSGDEEVNSTSNLVVGNIKRWAGFRGLTDTQIGTLAASIVTEIRARGSNDNAPIMSLGEFVNRRIDSASGLHALKGLLATALEKSGINGSNLGGDGRSIGASDSISPLHIKGVANAEARAGNTADGAPTVLTQGDLLTALAPVITVRGDTFRIRAYGESRSSSGNVEAKAWCEVVVQRLPTYVDSADSAEIAPAKLTSSANQKFGRRFVITSFRWLSSEEI